MCLCQMCTVILIELERERKNDTDVIIVYSISPFGSCTKIIIVILIDVLFKSKMMCKTMSKYIMIVVISGTWCANGNLYGMQSEGV